MKHLIRLAAAMLLGLAAPALAQEAPAVLEIGGARFHVPAPAGHCSDTPAVKAYFEMQRRGAPDAVPDLVFMPCDASDIFSSGMYAVMVFRQGPAMERAALLAELRETMPNADREMAAVNARAEQRYSTDGITVQSGIKAIGVDTMCGYIAGLISMEIEGSKVEVLMVGCMTAVGGRMICVYHYSIGSDPAAAAAEAPLVRRMAESIVAAQ